MNHTFLEVGKQVSFLPLKKAGRRKHPHLQTSTRAKPAWQPEAVLVNYFFTCTDRLVRIKCQHCWPLPGSCPLPSAGAPAPRDARSLWQGQLQLLRLHLMESHLEMTKLRPEIACGYNNLPSSQPNSTFIFITRFSQHPLLTKKLPHHIFSKNFPFQFHLSDRHTNHIQG